LQAFFAEVQGFIKERSPDAAMKPYLEPLGRALGHLQQATMWFMANAMGKPDNAGAGSTDYMQLFGLVALGYMWAKMAVAAQDKLKAGANGVAERMNAKPSAADLGARAAGDGAQLADPAGREHDGIAEEVLSLRRRSRRCPPVRPVRQAAAIITLLSFLRCLT
jgi:hypothetical protein